MVRGRPPVNKEKRRTTSLTLTDSNYDYFKANDLNLTKILNDSIDAMQHIDNYKLHELESKILKAKADLNIYQEEYNKLQIDIEQKEEIRRSQIINEQYEAYYLRKMYFEGKIKRKQALDLLESIRKDDAIVEYFRVEGRDLIWKGEKAKLSHTAILVLRNSNAVKTDYGYSIPEPKWFLTGVGLNDLTFDQELMIKDLENGNLPQDLLAGYFTKYHPHITAPGLARQIREEYSRMLMIGSVEWKGGE